MPHRARLSIIAALSVLLPALALVTPASAADEEPVSAYAPARESHVRAFPSQVRIVFRQSITVGSSISLSGPNGAVPCLQTSPTPAVPESSVVACRPTAASGAGTLDGVYTVVLEGVYANGDPTYEETYTFVVDTVTPPAPTGLAVSVDPYLSDSGDLVVSGTTETKTDTVFVTVGDGDRTVTASNGLTKATDDSRDFNIVVEADDVATLADGDLTVTARSRDRAVNDGPTTEITMTKDTATPSVVATDPADGAEVPGSELDYVVTASEALADTSSVRLFDSADAEVAAEVVVAGETVTASPSATVPDGAYRAEIDLVDTAGNAAATETRTFRVDNSGSPSTTARLPVKDGHHRTFPSQVRLIFDQQITAESTVSLSGPDGNPLTCQQDSPVVGTSSKLSCDPVGVESGAEPSPDGLYSVTFRAVPASGAAATQETYTWTLDTVAPPAPTELSASPSPYLLAHVGDEMVVSGLTEVKRDTVFVEITDGVTVLKESNGLTKEADDSREFNIVFEAADIARLTEGELTVSARSRDRAVNDGPSASITVVKSTEPPSVVSTDPDDGETVLGVDLVYTVTSDEPLDAASSVRLLDGDGQAVAGVVEVDGAEVTATPAASLPEGQYGVQIDLVDTDGNAAETVTRSFAVDNGPQVVTRTPAADAVVDTFPSQIRIDFDEPVTSDSTISLAGPGGPLTCTKGSPAGPPSTRLDCDPVGATSGAEATPDGVYTVTFTPHTERAGSAPKGDHSFTLDTVEPSTAPATPTLEQPDAVTIAAPGLSLSGSGEAGSTVTVTVTDSQAGEVTKSTVVEEDGAWALAVAVDTLSEGDLSITATATDGDGNSSDPSAAVIVVKDTVAPEVSALSATDVETDDPVTTVTGTRSEVADVTITASRGTMTATVTVPRGNGLFGIDLDLTGFDAGTVRVTAGSVDQVGNDGELAVTALELTRTQSSTQTTLERSDRVIKAGRPLTLSGTVTRADDDVEAGQVEILAVTRRNELLNFGTVALDSDGTFETRLRPIVDATFVARYTGDAGNDRSTSVGQRVRVRFGVSAAPSRLRKRKQIVVKGSVLPNREDVTIQVFRKRANGKKLLDTTTTNGRGNYRVQVRLPRKRSKIVVRALGTLDNTRGAKRFVIRR